MWGNSNRSEMQVYRQNENPVKWLVFLAVIVVGVVSYLSVQASRVPDPMTVAGAHKIDAETQVFLEKAQDERELRKITQDAERAIQNARVEAEKARVKNEAARAEQDAAANAERWNRVLVFAGAAFVLAALAVLFRQLIAFKETFKSTRTAEPLATVNPVMQAVFTNAATQQAVSAQNAVLAQNATLQELESLKMNQEALLRKLELMQEQLNEMHHRTILANPNIILPVDRRVHPAILQRVA